MIHQDCSADGQGASEASSHHIFPKLNLFFIFFYFLWGGGLVSDNFSNFLKPASDNHTPLTLGFVCQFHLLSKVLFFPFLRQLFLSIISVQWSAMH